MLRSSFATGRHFTLATEKKAPASTPRYIIDDVAKSCTINLQLLHEASAVTSGEATYWPVDADAPPQNPKTSYYHQILTLYAPPLGPICCTPPQPSSSSKPSSLEPITGSQEDEKCSAYTRFPSRLASVTAAADGLSSHPIRACALCLCFLRSGETASRRLLCLSQRSCGAPLQSGRRRLATCLHLVRALLEVAEVHKAAIYLFLVDICLFLSQVI